MVQPVLSLLLFIAASIASSYLFFRAGVPAGTIIGPIAAIAALQAAGIPLVIPPHTDTVLISVFGVYFATRMRGIVRLRGTALLAPVMATALWFIAQTFFASFVLRRIMDISTTNAYLAVIPGGIAEMNIVTLSYGANVSIINAFHLARLFSIILIVPTALKTVYRNTVSHRRRTGDTFFPVTTEPLQIWRVALMFTIGATGSLVFMALQIPAGGLMGALSFVMVFEILTPLRPRPPQWLFVVIVSILGGTIGLNIDTGVLQNASQLLLPIVVITVITLSGAAILAFLLHRTFHREYLPTLLGVMPGGLAVMMTLAESATDDLFYVTSLQTIRLLTAVVILPNLLLVTGVITPL